MSLFSDVVDMRESGMSWLDILETLTDEGIDGDSLEGPEGVFSAVQLEEDGE